MFPAQSLIQAVFRLTVKRSTPDTNTQFDAIILGFGKGSKTIAGKLASIGKTVALIEKSPNMYGGTCINVGCIPSKSLIYSALSSSVVQSTWEEKQAAYAAAITEKRRVTAMLRQKNYDKLASHPNITVVDGLGSFLSSTSVRVATA